MSEEQARTLPQAMVRQLAHEYGWELSLEELDRYAEQLYRFRGVAGAVGEVRERAMLVNYHYDHELVESLRDPSHEEHLRYWYNWSSQAIRTLNARFRNLQALDVSIGLEDLVQEALQDLWCAIGSFRYESRFQTWAYTVIANCFVRSYRSHRAKKRGGGSQALSLDALLALDTTLAPSGGPDPDETTLESSLAALLQEILAAHPDDRLCVIFHLWAYEDQPLRVIGEQLSLSVPRVHNLLRQALAVLRNEAKIVEWYKPAL